MDIINKNLIALESFIIFNKTRLALLLNSLLLFALALLYFFISSFPNYLDSSPYKFISYYSLLVWLFFPFFSLLFFNIDRRFNTLNRLKSFNLSASTIINSKLIAYKALLYIAFINIVFITIVSSFWYYIDLGLILSGIIEISLVILTSLSLAMWASSLNSKTLFAPLIAFFIALIMLVADVLTIYSNNLFKPLLNYFAFNVRLISLRLGLLNYSDIFYFIGLIQLFYRLTYYNIKKIALNKRQYLLLLIPFILALNSRYAIQNDLTFNRQHSLSNFSRDISKNLKSPLYLTYYTSPRLNHDMAIKKTFEHILNYQKASRLIYVTRDNSISDEKAKQMGFSLQNGSHGSALFAGLTIEYKNKLLTIPFLIDYDEVEYQISYQLNKLINSSKKIFLLTGVNRNDTDFSLMKLMIKNHFELSPSLDEADTIIVADDSSITSEQSISLWRSVEKGGKSLLVTLAPGVINITNNDIQPIMRTEKPFTTLLYNKGLSISASFVEDNLGLMVANKKSGEGLRIENYKNWPNSFGYPSQSMLALISNSLKVLYSGYLDIDNNWQVLLKSFNSSYSRNGFINLNIKQDNLPEQIQKGPFILMAHHKKLPVVVVASDTIFSDLVNSAYPSNLALADLLLTHLSGNEALSKIKAKFFTNSLVKHQFNIKTDSYKFLIILFLYLILNIISIKKLFKTKELY